ncbi:MAG: Vms1/Ankzf1 family peptidyl-tRNA hydrolase, partial [Mycobacteriales bacterium]
MPARPAAGGGRWVTVSPERLARWLTGFADRHGAVVTSYGGQQVVLTAADGAVATVEVPFPPLTGDLVAHALRERTVGVLLVRLGGHAAGVFAGPRLVASKVGSRQVHGRSA